jgi:hypothetical protein
MLLKSQLIGQTDETAYWQALAEAVLFKPLPAGKTNPPTRI